MAPSIRKALGVVKDRTSIGLAKMSGAMAPELDVAIIRATSHADETADEKHLRRILCVTSYSRGYVIACIATVSRRLGKTRDWVVALKALMLVHRLMVDGDPAFLHEIMYATRRGTRLLNMADFRDAKHSDSSDRSAFVRSYAMYLDQRLEFVVYEKKQSGAVRPNQSPRDRWRSASQSRYDLGEPDPYSNGGHGRYSYSSPSGNGGAIYDQRQEAEREKTTTSLKDMKPERVLGRTHQLQQLLDRFLACRPTGNAKFCRLIIVALYPVVTESFQLYLDVAEMLSILLDRFFDMEYPQCAKAFEAYAIASKQIDELCSFYAWCKDTGVARSSEYPDVQRITDKLLVQLEDFLRGMARKSRNLPREAPPATSQDEEKPVQDMTSMKTLPGLSDYKKEQTLVEPAAPPQQEGDLLDLRDDAVSAEDHSNSLALALFQGPLAADGAHGPWQPAATSAWQMPATELGNADWELMLVEMASNLSKQKAALDGGFNPLLLNGKYNQGIHTSTQIHGGSAGGVALPSPSSSASTSTSTAPVGQDPFAASLSIPPPSYVLVADIQKKQQLLDQEQVVWQQYANDGMQGTASLSKLQVDFIPNQQMPYGAAGGFYHRAYRTI